MRRKKVFRTIALGDIDLLNEIRVDYSGVVDRWTRRASFRRTYCARIEGRGSQHMTVAMYQGNGAAEVSVRARLCGNLDLERITLRRSNGVVLSRSMD
jgi:hypothetical protein